jgi:hypothetical protein
MMLLISHCSNLKEPGVTLSFSLLLHTETISSIGKSKSYCHLQIQKEPKLTQKAVCSQ